MNRCFRACLSLSALTLIGCGSNTKFAPPGTDKSLNTITPIHHLIIVIGENRSFDNLFATYQPPARSQTMRLEPLRAALLPDIDFFSKLFSEPPDLSNRRYRVPASNSELTTPSSSSFLSAAMDASWWMR